MKGTFVFNLEPLGPFKFVSKPYILAMKPIEIPETQRKRVAWWKFDEPEGDAMSDSSGTDPLGTLVGGPQWQPGGGKVGGALAFDGVDDYTDCGSHEDLNLTRAVSVSAWIKLAGPAEDQKIVGNQDNISGGYKVGVYDNKLELEIRDSSNLYTNNRFVEGGTVLEPGVWYHVVGTYCQGGSIKVYVNAKLDREIVTPSILAPSAGTLKIGREPFSDLFWFNGLMDDLQIYNYPLAEAEIASLYSGKAPIAAVNEFDISSGGNRRNWTVISVIFAVSAVAAAIAVLKMTKVL